MEEAGGVLIDTSVLVSKKLGTVLGLREPLYVTPVVILEYLNWVIESRNMWFTKGDTKRAEGYERLVKLLQGLLEELDVEVVDQKLDIVDLGDIVTLVLEREVDPGNALNAVTAKKMNLKVVTRDKDWEKLRDYAKEVILV